jgi:hypothetical protein
MAYAVEMGSGAMVYIPSFRHSNVNRKKYADIHVGDRISLLSESRLKII